MDNDGGDDGDDDGGDDVDGDGGDDFFGLLSFSLGLFLDSITKVSDLGLGCLHFSGRY